MAEELRNEESLTQEIHQHAAKIYELRMLRLDEYAKAKGWEARGMDVLYLLLAEKYHWTPSQIRSLTSDEVDLFIDFLISSAKKKGVI